jgi:hypothetical protein
MVTVDKSCKHPECQLPAAARLRGDGYCRVHFLEVCYQRMDAYRLWCAGQSLEVVDPAEVREFISDCSREAADLAHTSRDLDNLERARLLDLLLSAAELGGVLRRGSRRSVAIPIRLILNRPGGWEEETETRVVSRHGANLRSRYPLEAEDTLIIVRRDNDRRASARVAWVRRQPDGSREIGLELLGSEDLWGLDWDAPDTPPARPRGPRPRPAKPAD